MNVSQINKVCVLTHKAVVLDNQIWSLVALLVAGAWALMIRGVPSNQAVL